MFTEHLEHPEYGDGVESMIELQIFADAFSLSENRCCCFSVFDIRKNLPDSAAQR